MANNFRKLYLLVWKNFILQIRRPIGTAVEVILPIGFLALLILARVKIKKAEHCPNVFSKINIHNKSQDLFDYVNILRQREEIVTAKSLRLGYYPIDEKTTLLLQSALANSGSPLVLATKSIKNKIFASLDDVVNDAKEYQENYIGVVIFKNVENTDSWPKHIEYTIRLHHTTGKLYNYRGRTTWLTKRIYPPYVPPGATETPLYKSPFLSLQYYVDSAIIRNHTGNDSAAQYIQQYPYPGYTFDLFVLMVAFLIPLMIILAYIYTAQMVVKELVSEKELRLTESMKMMGLPRWIHWTAWFIKVFLSFLVIIIIQTIILKAGKIFEYSHGGVVFVTLLLWVIASIFFLFLISVFFSNGTRGMLAASLLWFASFAPYLAIQNPDKYDGLTKEVKQALCLLPNTCLGIMVQIITRYEGEQIGVNWGNIDEPVTIDEDFALSSAFGILILDCIIFFILTWYIENVFPGDYGVPRPFYFPFQPSYWCGQSVISGGTDHMEMSQMNDNFEEEPSGLEVGISMKNMQKVFKSATGKKTAVDDLSLNIYKGQITALLGHNGAGKTTIISMLTGLYPPSRGEATINGRSISTDMDSIRDSLGLCPQHNVLFDRLTVKEHLQFFSALKGTPKAIAEDEVMKLIEDLQLLDKTNARSSTLSGGMKRKLNCAIALVGGSETIFLDEPTSGMDPYARRATWDILQRYRGNKTIILTTHFMDEADYLGDRIAIMANGKVYCCGSSLFLKKRFGVGYHLTLVKSPEFQENQTLSLINNMIPTAKMVGNIAAELSYVLPEESSKSFKGLFQKLEDEKLNYGIASFGVSVTTLEEVFLKVGEGDTLEGKVSVEVTDDKEKLHVTLDNLNTTIRDDVLKSGFALRASQFKAMFVKRYLNSKRQKKSLLTQIILPLGLLLIGLLLSTSQGTQVDDPLLKLSLSMLKGKSDELVAFFGDTSSSNASAKKSLKESATSYYSSVQVQLKDLSVKIANISDGNKGDKVNVIYSENPYSGKVTTNNKSACCKYQYLVLNKQCAKVPKREVLCPDEGKCVLKPPPVDSSNLLEYVLEDSGKNIKKYFNMKVAGFTIDNQTTSPIVWYSNQAYHTLPSAYSAANNIILRYQMNDANYGIVTNNHPLPRNTDEKSDLSKQNWGNLTLIIFLQMGICLLAASFIIFLIEEKTSKAKHVQFVSGVNAICYWGATYCWDMVNYIFPAVGFVILFAIFDMDDYRGELGPVFLITLLYGVSILPFVYILSFIFTSALMGYGFTSMLVQVLSLAMYISVLICNMVDEEDVAKILHHVFLLFPTYAYPKALGEIAENNVQRRNCNKDSIAKFKCEMTAKMTGKALYQENTFSSYSPGIGYHCWYMFLVAIFYFILVLLIEANFFLGHFLSYRKNRVFATNASEDPDVTAEREKIHSMRPDEISNTALVLKDLTKVYRTNGMVAVDHLNLEIPKGECFGLLGINGAGKTTTFGILTGELGITEGKAYIHGYDIQTQLKQVQQLIGYCPQFDALVETMTGREMLRMFACLRGIPSCMVDDVVTNVVDTLNLKNWADKMCGTYSGGNKRKLSTAMALVGNPSVVFLDEPTSGMDPGSRRHLWDTLSGVLNSGKSIILTSHSMEECEALCTRLVIMVNGKFKCIGSIQHLKSRFGQGYTVMLKINPNYNHALHEQPADVEGSAYARKESACSPKDTSNFRDHKTNPGYQDGDAERQPPIECVKSFMHTNFPGALLLEEHQGLLQYQIVDRTIKLSETFGTLEENVEALGIIDYSVCQTSLEQVFINFAKEQHSENRNKRKMCCSCNCF